jgi:hypothetical protein
MTAIEDRLRAATKAIAQTVADDSAPPLRLPLPARTPGRGHMPPRVPRNLEAQRRISPGPLARRWPAAAAAAAGVVAVVAISVALTGGPRPARPAGASPLAQPPPYYVALTATSKGPTPRLDAVIHNTRTGATVATIKPPRPFTTFSEVTGAANDRTFVLAAQPRAWPVVSDPAAFFRASFDPATGKVELTRLAVPELTAASELASVALSPDGGELAIAAGTGKGDATAQVSVYSLVRGTVRTWQDPGTIGYGAADYLGLSWARGGLLAVNWVGETAQDGVRLLNTRTEGGSLLADSKLVVGEQDHPHGFNFDWDGVIAPDGRTIIAPMWRPGAIKDGKLVRAAIGAEFQEFSVATGKEIRSLWPVHYPVENIAWSNPSGSLLLVAAPATSGKNSSSHAVFGLLRGSHFVPLRGAPVPDGFYPDPQF